MEILRMDWAMLIGITPVLLGYVGISVHHLEASQDCSGTDHSGRERLVIDAAVDRYDLVTVDLHRVLPVWPGLVEADPAEGEGSVLGSVTDIMAHLAQLLGLS